MTTNLTGRRNPTQLKMSKESEQTSSLGCANGQRVRRDARPDCQESENQHHRRGGEDGEGPAGQA